MLTNQRSPVSRVSSETSFRSKLFWTMGREYAWILGEGTPFGGRGPRAPQRGMISISWVWTGEERRRSKMTKDKEDSSITASRSDYAQSKCHCASGSNSVRYPLWELWLLYYCFKKINHLVPVTICIHPMMYVKPCREQKQPKLEPKLVSALSETRTFVRLFHFNIETGSFGVSKQPEQTKDQPKQQQIC